jgi:SAM-dependent methyltransferase
MSQDPSSFVGSIPDFYDRNLGPNIFADYADEIAKRVAAHSPRNVLELAAGTGIVTLALRKHLPPSTQLTVTDLNQPMLDIAQKKFADAQNLTFQIADAQNIPFPDQSFDAVVCQFGIMFFPDKDRSYREVYRVLAKGGRYIFNVWDASSFNSFGRIAHATIGSFFESDPPKFYETPFGYHSLDAIKQSLIAAGFGGIAMTVRSRNKRAGDLAAFAEGLVRGNPAIEEIKARASVPPETIIAALAEKLKSELGPTRRMPLQAIFFRARKR